jgi:chromate transport protein ChrA
VTTVHPAAAPPATAARATTSPVAIGLAVAGLITFGKSAVTGWITLLLGALTFFAVVRTRINPVAFVLGGAIIGVIALR